MITDCHVFLYAKYFELLHSCDITVYSNWFHVIHSMLFLETILVLLREVITFSKRFYEA